MSTESHPRGTYPEKKKKEAEKPKSVSPPAIFRREMHKRTSDRSVELGHRLEALLAAMRGKPQAFIYSVGALVAASDGISARESEALTTVSRLLQVDAVTKRKIDDACQVLPVGDGLTAVLEAYVEEKGDLAVKVRDSAESRLLDLPMFDASEVSARLGSRSSNQRQYAAKLRERGDILGLRRGNRFVYPVFQFDLNRGTVFPEVVEVGKILNAKSDPWGVVDWWVSPHPRLSKGTAPKDLLGTPNSQDVMTLAGSAGERVG